MAVALDPRANQILAALPDEELQYWLPGLEPVTLSAGEVLYEPGEPLAHVYFPTRAVVSLPFLAEGDAPDEIALIGREGVVGVSLFMGDTCLHRRAVVQNAGAGYRLQGQVLKDAFRRTPLLHAVLHFTQALVTQMAQTAVCRREHLPERRLCRWLLLSLDRLQADAADAVHELSLPKLGMPGGRVAEAVQQLQLEGLIHHGAGHITVLDPAGLARRACGCYAAVRQEYARLLPAYVAL